jgi:formate dehydrogenase alpha subunit
MMTLDGSAVDARGSLLDVCRRAGAAVPAFCADDRVAPGGHCRACLVECDGRFVPACTTPARNGMVVHSDGERLRAYRRDLGELHVCESSPGGRVGAELAELGVTGSRYRRERVAARRDETHPYLQLDLDKCILCRLCVRACADVQGQLVYSVAGRGHDARLTWGRSAFAATDCTSCGACVAMCPTGAISDVDRRRSVDETRVVRTTCGYCGVGCQMDVHVAADDIVRIEGAPAAVNHAHLCVKGRYAHSFARHPERLTTPLVRRDGTLQPASWDEAIALVAREFSRLRGRLGALSSSRSTNEENYLVQKWFRGGLGTNNVDCCARVCHAPSAAGMRRSFGTGVATNSLADIEAADLVLVAGANVTRSHPVTGARIKQAVLGGARLVVIDPRRTELAAMADVHLQLEPGTNVPLLNSLAAVLVEERLVDRRFLAERTEGWDAYADFIRAFTPEATAATTGVSASAVRHAARLYARAERPMQVHGLGMTEHFQGSESVMLLCNLALLVGAIGRPGVGVNPLRGQNNVQGSADMGCQPDLLTGYADPKDPAVRARFETVWGRALPAEPGWTIPRMYDAIRRGELAGLFIFGEDVAATDPDSNRVVAALRSLDFLVVEELFLSTTAQLAHVVLPGASVFEKDGTFTNGERRIQRVRKALEPPGQARADWQILCALMAASGYPQPYTHPSQIMEEIARVAPPFAGVSYARLEGDGLQWPVASADDPGTEILHRDRFARGRAPLHRIEFAPSPTLTSAGDALLLVTGRALEHYNAGSMTRRSQNVALRSHDFLDIHPDDARARGIVDGAAVIVASSTGEARAVARVTDEVAPGTLFMTFHFAESGANRVTGDVVDRLSDCPEYKLTAVQVRAA